MLVFIFILFSTLSYSQTPTDSIGIKLGMSRENVIAALERLQIKYNIEDKNNIQITQPTVSIGSEFDNCRLSFRKGLFSEASFTKELLKNEEATMKIKFAYISKQLSEHFLMKRHMEQLQNGFYSGWSDIYKNYAVLKWETSDNGKGRLNLIYSSRKLF